MYIFSNVSEKLKKSLEEEELWDPYIRAINFAEYQTEKEKLIKESKDLPAQELAAKLSELAKKYNL